LIGESNIAKHPLPQKLPQKKFDEFINHTLFQLLHREHSK